MKNNRILSFIVLAVVYAIAGVAAYFIYFNLDFSFWLNIFIADAAATVIVYIFSVIFKNASVYDPYWSVAPVYMIFILANTNELNTVRALMALAVIGWGIRLTANWAYTFENLNAQDWRYTMLQEKTGVFYQFVNFTGIHMVPTIVVFFCMLPVCYAFKYDVQMNGAVSIFFVLAVFAFVMQGTADVQMHKFRKNKNGVFNRNGLWKHSRHPNYLGEILMWWSMGLMSISALGGPIKLLGGAVINTCLFLFISIPMAENHQRSRKPGFDEYKAETRMLLPIAKLSDLRRQHS